MNRKLTSEIGTRKIKDNISVLCFSESLSIHLVLSSQETKNHTLLRTKGCVSKEKQTLKEQQQQKNNNKKNSISNNIVYKKKDDIHDS